MTPRVNGVADYSKMGESKRKLKLMYRLSIPYLQVVFENLLLEGGKDLGVFCICLKIE